MRGPCATAWAAMGSSTRRTGMSTRGRAASAKGPMDEQVTSTASAPAVAAAVTYEARRAAVRGRGPWATVSREQALVDDVVGVRVGSELPQERVEDGGQRGDGVQDADAGRVRGRSAGIRRLVLLRRGGLPPGAAVGVDDVGEQA